MTEKRFPPSAKRLQRARREGKTIKEPLVSAAIGWWCVLLVVPVSVAWVTPGYLVDYVQLSKDPLAALGAAFQCAGKILAISIGSTAVLGTAVALLQSGVLFVPSLALPQLDRLNPAAYFGRVKSGAADVAIGGVRCCIFFLAASPVLYEALEYSVSPSQSEAVSVKQAMLDCVMRITAVSASVLTLFALIGYGFARRRFLRMHGMSFEELREELRDDEGDPHVRSARRMEHEALAMQEIERRVRRAKVIVIRRSPEFG